MNNNFELDKDFSSDFMNDLADVMGICMKNNTDNIQMEFDIGDNTILVYMMFRCIKK